MSLANPTVTAPISYHGTAQLKTSGKHGSVASFRLGVRISIPVRFPRYSEGRASRRSVIDMYPYPSGSRSALPSGSRPAAAATHRKPVSRRHHAAVGIGAHVLHGTGDDGQAGENYRLSMVSGSGWRPLHAQSNPSPAITSPGINTPAGLAVNIDPYLNVDEGIAARLQSAFSMSPINLGFVDLAGHVTANLAPPFRPSALNYSGPRWTSKGTLSDNPEVNPSIAISPVLRYFGLPTPNISWKSAYTSTFAAGTTPQFQALATPQFLTVGDGDVSLSSNLGPGFENDTVQFYGFHNSSSQGRLLATATVSRGDAVTSWQQHTAGPTPAIGLLCLDSSRARSPRCHTPHLQTLP